jgi:hypothetical protein
MTLRELGNNTITKPQGGMLFYKEGDTADIATKLLKVYRDQRHQVARLAPALRGATLLDTCRNVWRIVKENIRYQMDPKGNQWVRRPAQMWWSGVGDCKSYSVFIASCLDALGILGTFRFVSYVEDDATPTHVYVVVKNNGAEIILDAVMPGFNQEKPFEHKYDYNMTRIYELSGIAGKGRYTTGSALLGALKMSNRNSVMGAIDPVTAMAFVGKVQAIAPKVVAFFKNIFGGGSQYTEGVQWLTAYYQYYVLGDASATGRTKAKDQYTPEAQGWFATVLGVPIYDRFRLHALMGTNPVNGASLNKSDAQKAADYLALGNDTKDQSPAAVAQAVQIAKRFRWAPEGTPGSWKQWSIAAPAVTPTQQTTTPSGSFPLPTDQPYAPTGYPTGTPIQQPGTNQPEPQQAGSNTLLYVGLAIGVGALLMGGGKK